MKKFTEQYVVEEWPTILLEVVSIPLQHYPEEPNNFAVSVVVIHASRQSDRTDVGSGKRDANGFVIKVCTLARDDGALSCV